MGNTTSSNRRVTVVNDDVVGVVQVSENVIRRLRGMPEKSPEPERPATPENRRSQESAPPPNFIPFAPPEPYSSTLEQRQKYHEEFKKAERSWNNRILELELQNRHLYETTKKNFAATLTEVEDKHVKNSFAPVCPDKEQKVLQCYKDNAKLPLNCSQEVHDFMQCVDKVRMSVLAK